MVVHPLNTQIWRSYLGFDYQKGPFQSMEFTDGAKALGKGSSGLLELTNVNQAVHRPGKPWHHPVKLLYRWRNGITISYELNCFCPLCLVSTRGLNASTWPCPGRKERVWRTCRIQIPLSVMEPQRICDNKTKETNTCVLAAYRDGFRSSAPTCKLRHPPNLPKIHSSPRGWLLK